MLVPSRTRNVSALTWAERKAENKACIHAAVNALVNVEDPGAVRSLASHRARNVLFCSARVLTFIPVKYDPRRCAQHFYSELHTQVWWARKWIRGLIMGIGWIVINRATVIKSAWAERVLINVNSSDYLYQGCPIWSSRAKHGVYIARSMLTERIKMSFNGCWTACNTSCNTSSDHRFIWQFDIERGALWSCHNIEGSATRSGILFLA